MSACAACLFADVMAQGSSELPERERYAFAFATGVGHLLAGEPLALCPEHAKDAAAVCHGALEAASRELDARRRTGTS